MRILDISLTEQCIVNVVLPLRAAPLDTPEKPLSLAGRITHIFLSELVTRIISLATSLFALADCLIHLTAAITKSVTWSASCDEIFYHLKQAIKYLFIAAIGSLCATLWPDALKYFTKTPFDGRGGDWKSTSTKVQALWAAAADKKQFQSLWQNAHLDEKRTFVSILDGDSTLKAMQCKRENIDLIYQKLTSPQVDSWPSQNSYSTFYHATTLEGLEGILKSGYVEVRHEKAYRGAFVSTRPENFGDYVLVFNRSIERMSPLCHGFTVNNAYWSGFSSDIPVNATTLVEVMYNGDRSKLEKKCSAWSGRTITVSPLTSSYQSVIPEEWPGVSDKGPKRRGHTPAMQVEAIVQTMEIRYKQYVAQKVAVAHAPALHVRHPQRRQANASYAF